MALSQGQLLLLCAIGILLWAKPAHAFGAGNIGSTSKIEGQNWRHGDLEDTLLTIVASKAMGGKKFGKLDVKRVYFGNWLRDYSQAVDVGTVKYVSAEAIRILLWVLGFMSFGYGSKEFEVTTERLGCYRPEEHIDNPKDYAENEDARQYDRRLRGPVDERRELAINPDTGMKNYIASENMGIDTSAGLVRKLFTRCIQLGRQYARSKNKKDLHEALRLLGTGSHCLEDFAAHSNYVELALIEMGERDVFPHTGRRTCVQLRGARNEVYPLVTGTFGGVDFLHSVCGEFDDKVTQSEVEELEGTLQQADNSQDGSILQDLFDKVPSGVFGDKDEKAEAEKLKQNAQAHRMSNARISPRQPEEWTRYLDDVRTQIYPIIEWHDEVMQSITKTVEKIPILPDLIDNIQDEVNKFVFSLLAPYVVPIIHQVKNELNTGSSEIIQGSKNAQHIVFNDDRSSDPTHSMLSKDHFSNILNEPAGKVASWTVKWVVPQLIAAWDDEHIDIDRTCDRIIRGILHHPAQRGATGIDGAGDGRRAMFQVVEKWWHNMGEREKNEYRDKLSRRGVEQGRNHKEGVKDHGHGSMKPLGMANVHDKSSYPAAQAVSAVGNLVGELTGSVGGQGRPQSGQYGGGQYSGGQYGRQGGQSDTIGRTASQAVGGGLLGTLVGGVASAVGKDMLGGGLDDEKKTYKRESYGHDGSRTETYTQVGRSSGGDRYGQAQYSRTEEPSGGRTEQYTRYEQHPTRGGGYQTEVKREERDSQGRYHEDTQRYSGSGGHGSGPGGYGSNTSGYGQSETYSREDTTSSYSSGGYGQPQRRRDSNDSDKKSSRYGKKDDSDDDDYKKKSRYGKKDDSDDDDYKKKKYGKKDESDSDDGKKRNKRSSGYGGSEYQSQQPVYGSGGYGGHEERSEYSSGGGYGRQEQSYGGGAGGYGRQEQQTSGYGRRDEDESYGRGGGGGYGSQQQSYGRQEGSYGSGGGQGYGGQQQGYGAGGGYSSQQESYGTGGGYGRQEQSSYGGGGQYGGGRQDESYGGGYAAGGGGGRQEYGGRGDDEGGVNMPGGFGEGDGNQSYGGRRRGDDDGGYGRY